MIASKASCSLSYRIGDLQRSRYCRGHCEINLGSFEIGRRRVEMNRRRERVEYKPC